MMALLKRCNFFSIKYYICCNQIYFIGKKYVASLYNKYFIWYLFGGELGKKKTWKLKILKKHFFSSSWKFKMKLCFKLRKEENVEDFKRFI